LVIKNKVPWHTYQAYQGYILLLEIVVKGKCATNVVCTVKQVCAARTYKLIIVVNLTGIFVVTLIDYVCLWLESNHKRNYVNSEAK